MRILVLLVAVSWFATPAGAEVRVRWLGVAGFTIEAGDDTLLHDPYLSRPGLWRTLTRRYEPDAAVLEPLVDAAGPAPELGRADLVLIGHSHFDHLGDAPWLAERTGATVAGSTTTVAISRGYGLPDTQVRRVDPGDTFQHGAFDVRVVESRHAKIFFGRPPLVGVVEKPPSGPIHSFSFKLGDARGYLVTHRASGLRIFLLSSAGYHRPALEALAAEGVTVDVLAASVVGGPDDYERVLVETLRPRIVVPQHFDDFFVPLSDPDAVTPQDPEALEAFEDAVRAAAVAIGHEVEIRRPTLFGTVLGVAAPLP